MLELIRRTWATEADRLSLYELLDERYSGSDFVDSLKKDPINSCFYQQPDWPYYALSAVKTSQISISIFATLMIVREIKLKTPASEISWVAMFINGRINALAFDLIFSTFQPVKDSEIYNRLRYTKPQITKEELTQTFLKFKPHSLDHYLLVYPDDSNEKAISSQIYKLTGLNLVDRVTYQNRRGRLFVSCTFWEALLQTKFSSQAVKPNYVIGTSDRHDLTVNALKNERDIQIPFLTSRLPSEADSFPAPGIDFFRHDATYHLYVACFIPPSIKRAFIEIAKIIQGYFPHEFAGSFSEEQKMAIILNCIDHIIDLDCPFFRDEWRAFFEKSSKTLSPSAYFWIGIAGLICRSHVRASSSAAFRNVPHSEALALSFLRSKIAPRLIRDLLLKPDLLKPYGIMIKDLEPAYMALSTYLPDDKNNHVHPFYDAFLKL